ncbi:MAG: hypothetical protein H6672_04870 [Anaerolineaceae bacterium]|nr:hypothetical protein [Anaerolineaceae bacterium]
MTTEEKILFEYEDETRYYTWQRGTVAFQENAVVIRGVRPGFTCSLSVSEITGYETIMKQDINFAEYVLGAVMYDWSGVLVMLLAPLTLLDMLIARKTMLSVPRLTWVEPDEAQTVMISLRSRQRRRRGQAETTQLSQRIVDFLRRNAYVGSLPD